MLWKRTIYVCNTTLSHVIVTQISNMSDIEVTFGLLPSIFIYFSFVIPPSFLPPPRWYPHLPCTVSLSLETLTHIIPHTLSQLSADRGPAVFLLTLPLSQYLHYWIIHCRHCYPNARTHTHMLIHSRFTFIGTCVTHAHTRSLCLTPTCADRRARRGEDTCALTHVHTCMCTHTPTPTRMEPHCFSFPFGQNGTMGRFHYPV